MISTFHTHRVGFEPIDDPRREAEPWRRAKLARAELNPSPSTTQPAVSETLMMLTRRTLLLPSAVRDDDESTLIDATTRGVDKLSAAAARARGEIRRGALTLGPGRAQP